jgi:hypothetical protein
VEEVYEVENMSCGQGHNLSEYGIPADELHVGKDIQHRPTDTNVDA